MKVLFILPEYYPHSGGGISTYYLHYIRSLSSVCENVKVIVGSGYTQSDDVLSHEGVDIEYLKPALHQKYLKQFSQHDLFPDFRKNISAAWAMWEQANGGEGFDIIECADFGIGFIPWLLNKNKPVIIRLHGSAGQIALHDSTDEHILNAQLYRSAESALLPLADMLISHSQSNKQFWDDILGGVEIRHIYPVYHITEKPENATQVENLALTTARIQKWKGPEELCQALGLTTPSFIFKWYGRNTPYKPKISTLQHLEKSFPEVYGKKLSFNAPLPQDEIRKMQQKARFGVVPSTWDMFNFTVVEFMALGKPVICSEGAGASELIEHEKNGFKYPPHDIAALADCITAADQLNEAAYTQMANAAFETVSSKLNEEKLIGINLECYHAVLANFKPAGSNSYFDTAYRPSEKTVELEQIFDKHPVRLFSKYLLRRMRSKLFTR